MEHKHENNGDGHSIEDNYATSGNAAALPVPEGFSTALSPRKREHTPGPATRVNWSKPPHSERLEKYLFDWFSRSGLALDDYTGQPISDYKVYATKVRNLVVVAYDLANNGTKLADSSAPQNSAVFLALLSSSMCTRIQTRGGWWVPVGKDGGRND